MYPKIFLRLYKNDTTNKEIILNKFTLGKNYFYRIKFTVISRSELCTLIILDTAENSF